MRSTFELAQQLVRLLCYKDLGFEVSMEFPKQMGWVCLLQPYDLDLPDTDDMDNYIDAMWDAAVGCGYLKQSIDCTSMGQEYDAYEVTETLVAEVSRMQSRIAEMSQRVEVSLVQPSGDLGPVQSSNKPDEEV